MTNPRQTLFDWLLSPARVSVHQPMGVNYRNTAANRSAANFPAGELFGRRLIRRPSSLSLPHPHSVLSLPLELDRVKLNLKLKTLSPSGQFGTVSSGFFMVPRFWNPNVWGFRKLPWDFGDFRFELQQAPSVGSAKLGFAIAS